MTEKMIENFKKELATAFSTRTDLISVYPGSCSTHVIIRDPHPFLTSKRINELQDKFGNFSASVSALNIYLLFNTDDILFFNSNLNNLTKI